MKRPFHAIVSARAALAQTCGARADAVERAMSDLAAAVKRCEGVATQIIWIDDAAALAPWGLSPVRARGAASVKQLLDDLDDALGQRGLELASVLIVGGDEIIPFHRLPNPADDPDVDVPTDAPYACRGHSAILPERWVGRMPQGAAEAGQGAAADLLLQQLGAALRARANSPSLNVQRQAKGALNWLRGRRAADARRSWGYSASIWRRAAQHVFGVIGPAQAMRLSPPLAQPELAGLLAQARPQLAYFNLHGLADSPHWYGQRDPEFIADYAPFPVALSPADIVHPADVVLSAACYGAHLAGRDASNSIALRCMQAGTLALVGSTSVAYGGLDKPLLGVDLLGQLFWQQIAAGRSAGEALCQAKIGFAVQLQERQGYLDGEDYKTLFSFILLGDPRLAPLSVSDKTAKWAPLPPAALSAPLLCARARGAATAEHLAQAKQYVARALPGMEQADAQIARPAPCAGKCSGGRCSRRVPDAAYAAPAPPVQVSLSKTMLYGDHNGVQMVRVTLDAAGKVIKLAMSK